MAPNGGISLQRENRRLAAIVAADRAGYSRLIGRDEEGTLRALRVHRAELIDPLVEQHGGRIANTAGDSLLLEFPSAVDAVRCCIAVQEGMAEGTSNIEADRRITFRVGINVGDVVAQGGDLLGDGVNVAARLEGLAEPGGLCLSATAYDYVSGNVDASFVDAGEHEVKNIARPVHVWRWSLSVQRPTAMVSSDSEMLPLPTKPSIAVLPFDNMSGDPEQEYFVDGVVEDILTTLSKVPQLFVIARNSSFKYKGKNPDVRDVGRELGVRYVVEGSVRRAGNRVRVTAQLVDCTDGQHLWAERYDGELEDVFDLQDRLTREIVTALEVKLTFGEEVSVWRKRSGSPLVYEKHTKAVDLYVNFSKQTHRQAKQEVEEALQINPTYVPSMVILGYILADYGRFGWAPDRDVAFDEALAIAERALALDPDYGEVYSIISYVRSFQRRHDDAVAAAEQAVALGTNSANTYHMSGMAHIYAGNFETGRDYEGQASRLSPMAQEIFLIDWARAQFHLGEYDKARAISERVLKVMSRWLTAQTILLASLWRLGRKEEATKLGAAIRSSSPRFSVARWSSGYPYRREQDLQALMDPLLEAGLPE
jgi:TolB-like protein/class 3 adenylate cyclase/Tfp pilus assembly protein PilF